MVILKKKIVCFIKKKRKRKNVTNLVWPHKRVTYDTLCILHYIYFMAILKKCLIQKKIIVVCFFKKNKIKINKKICYHMILEKNV